MHKKLAKQKQTSIDLTNQEFSQMVDLAKGVSADASDDPELFCAQLKEMSTEIPKHIQDILQDFAKYGSETGFLRISCLANSAAILDKPLLERIQGMMVSVLGEMVAYEAESNGRLFQDIVPIQEMAKEQTSLGSSIELEIHTEQAFSNIRPDILTLGCIRGDANAFTHILPVQYITENMTEEEMQLLRAPLWKTGVDMSFKLHGHEFIEGDIRGPLAIIRGEVDDPDLVFDQDLMIGLDENGREMIKRIVDIYYKHRISHSLVPGEIVLIDNHRALHGRSPFFPRYDGNDRFLIRCFAQFDYEKSRYARPGGGRMIAAIYS